MPAPEVVVLDHAILLKVTVTRARADSIRKLPPDSVAAIKTIETLLPQGTLTSFFDRTRKLLAIRQAKMGRDAPDLVMNFLRFERALRGDQSALNVGNSVCLILCYPHAGSGAKVAFFPPGVGGFRRSLAAAHDEARRSLEEANGTSAPRTTTLKNKIRDAYRRADKVLVLLSQGYSRSTVSRKMKITISVAAGVGDGRIPLAILKRTDAHRTSRSKRFAVTKGPSDSFASVLGLYVGNSTVKPSLRRVQFISPVPEVKTEIKKNLDATFGSGFFLETERASPKGGTGKIFTFDARNAELAKYLYTATKGMTRVPWHHIVTRSETISFLRSIFDKKSVINDGEILLFKAGGAEILCDIARALQRIGITPRLVLNDRPHLAIYLPADFRTFRSVIGCSDPEKFAQLEAKCNGADAPAGTSAEYELVMSYKGAGLTTAEVQTQTGVSRDRVRGWLERGEVPHAAKNTNELEVHLRGRPDPRIAAFVVRELGGDLELVDTLIAMRVSFEDLIRLNVTGMSKKELLMDLHALFMQDGRVEDEWVGGTTGALDVLKARKNDLPDYTAIATSLCCEILAAHPELDPKDFDHARGERK